VPSIEYIEGIGKVNGKKLRAAGVKGTGTLRTLLTTCCDKKGRKAMAAETGISEKMLLEWANRADLMRVKGVGSVDTVKELRTRKPENLHAKMLEVNTKKKLVRRPPSMGEVQRWVDGAKGLDPVITH